MTVFPFLLSWVLSADAVTVTTKPRVLDPDRPSVTISVVQPIAGAVLTLKRSDGEFVSLRIEKTSRLTKVVKLEQPVGVPFDYEGQLHVEFDDGSSGDLPISLSQAEVTSPITVDTWGNAQDVKERRIRFKMTRVPHHVELVVFGETGRKLAEETVTVKNGRANVEQIINWPEVNETVLRIEAKFVDDKGLWRQMIVSPWFVEVPHEEVLFQTNRAEVQPSEQPKLNAALQAIIKASAVARPYAKISLYVLGHTDTVGKSEDNLRLSIARARSIAAYLKTHGWDLPVRYAGLGESALLVATADDKDEPRNRRAQYVVSIDPPPLGRPIEWLQY